MPIDRDATLKEAEQLLRQGKLDGAIEAYVRLVEDRPSDWSSINALGDLCLRAGDVERAIAQFTRVADQFFSDGSLQKAAALYKKTLRAQGDHEPALEQLGEIAVRQGLQADAQVYLNRLAEQRQLRGDEHGAAESLARLSALKAAQIESRIAAARAADEASDAPPTVAPPGATSDSGAVESVVAAGDTTADDAAASPQLSVPRESFDGSTTEEAGERGSPGALWTEREASNNDETPSQAEALPETEVSAEIDVPLEADVLGEIDSPIEIEVPVESEDPVAIEAAPEVELGDALDELAPAATEVAEVAVESTPPDLEEVPEHGAQESVGVDVAALESVVRDPETRFTAAMALGRYYIRQGDARTGIQWLERAVEATPPSQGEASSALYELADALESVGESPRALAALIDLDLDSSGYQDVRARIDRLMVAQTGSDAQ